MSQRKQEEDEVGERKTTRKLNPRQPSEQERHEHEMTHLPFRSRCRHCTNGRGREENCRTAAEERDKSHKSIWTTCSWVTKRKEKKTFVGGKMSSDLSSTEHRGSEEVNGRMDMPKADVMAA